MTKLRKLRTYRYVECRSLGHAWVPMEVTKRPPWGYYIAFECNRCNMVRRDIIDLHGAVSSRSYLSPDGYRNPDHKDRQEYRSEMITRLMKEKL